MNKPKYKLHERVTINHHGNYEVKGIEKHGDGNCDCCPKAKLYFMYQVTNNVWIAEEQLFKPTIN